MVIRSKTWPDLWYRFTDQCVTVQMGEDMKAWSWSLMQTTMNEMKSEAVKKELRRFAEGYRILRKTPKEERTLTWMSRMANIMGFTYGDMQMRISQKWIDWEEGQEC